MYARLTFTPLLLLLLLLMAPLIVPGGLDSLTLALNCTGTTTIKGPHEAATINDLYHWKDEDSEKLVFTYVHVEPGFKGVSVEAVVGGTTHAAFLPSDDTCFDDDTVWWWGVWARVKSTPHNNDNNDNDENLEDISFGAEFGRCRLLCNKTMKSLQAAWRLQVVAHGPSSWTTNTQGCTDEDYIVYTPTTTRCDDPPHPSPAEGPDTTSTRA